MKVKIYFRFLGAFAICMALLSNIALAQGKKVSGRITDASDDSGIPGASVTIKGTTRGVISDGDGKYTIE